MGASTNLTSTETIFPLSSMGNVEIIPWGWKVCPSNAFKMVDDVTRDGELRALQHDMDIIQVEDPSSIIVR